MWAKSVGFLFASRMVFLDETPEADPAICIDTSDLRRLLHRRLEVLEAALQRLAELRDTAANALEGNMQFFSITLHINVLRAIIEEIESEDPRNPTLVDLRLTLQEQLKRLIALRSGEPSAPKLPGAA